MSVTFLTNEDKKLIDVEIENLSKENERLSEEVNDLKENGTGNGLTTEMVTALDNMFKVCAYSKEDISEEYGAFRKAFGLEEEPTPDFTLIEGYYSDDGSIVIYENMHRSSLIPIKECIVSANKDRFLRISYFDKDENYLGYDRGYGLNVVPPDWNSASEVIVTPYIAENIGYFAINANTADKSTITIRTVENAE